MSKQTTFATTDAGHKFLELYAEPVVTNTYLKVAIMVLSIVALALLALLYRTQTAALRLKPLVISVSDIGRGHGSLRRPSLPGWQTARAGS
jgi:type IV secretion system protein VirB5